MGSEKSLCGEKLSGVGEYFGVVVVEDYLW